MFGEIDTGFSFWSWLIFGLLLMVAELFVPGVFIVWIGLASFISGIIFCIFDNLSLSYQLLIFAGLSVVCVIVGWYVYGQVLTKSSRKDYKTLNNGAESFIGNEYSLLEDVFDGRSKAKVGDTVWLVQAPEGLKKGAKVVVESVDGVILHVKKKDK